MLDSTSLKIGSEPMFCFPYDKLTQLLQRAVIEKLLFTEWILLSQCSKSAMDSCQLITQRIPLESLCVKASQRGKSRNPEDWLEIYNDTPDCGRHEMQCYNSHKRIDDILAFPCRIATEELYIQRNLTSEDVEVLRNIVGSNGMTASAMLISGLILCSAEEFVKLVEESGISQDQNRVEQMAKEIRARKLRSFNCQSRLKEILDFSYIQEMDDISVDDLAIEDDQLLLLHAPCIKLSGENLSSVAIKRFLKEWQKGEREIERLQLKFDEEEERNFEEIIDGVANLVWSPETHRISLASMFHEDDVSELTMRFPHSYYALWRTENIEDSRIIMLSQKELIMMEGNYVSCFTWALGYDMCNRIFNNEMD